MSQEARRAATEARFLEQLRHHLAGWLAKVNADLSADNFDLEVGRLSADPVYRSFGLASDEYALIRLMGRLSISIGRRLGEIYDKLPRIVTQSRFDLAPSEVAPRIGGALELDICIPLGELTARDQHHVIDTVHSFVPAATKYTALALEIRYNFNPNDSSRLRKDAQMASLLLAQGYLPVYLIFSTISPRDEAIARLGRAGWTFLVGNVASSFMNNLIEIDFEELLSAPAVTSELKREVSRIMTAIYTSPALIRTTAKYSIGSLDLF